MVLNQVLAIEKALKAKSTEVGTQAYHLLQKADPLTGIHRAYRPKDDENGERLPEESKRVQVNALHVMGEVFESLGRFFAVTISKDAANRTAVGTIAVDGTILAKDVPVTTLLFLEKKLVDLHTSVKKIPTLDPSEDWTYDEAQDCWASEPRETHRTTKVQRPLTLAPATDKHPAQVQMITEDVIAGYWTTRKFSGAMPAAQVNSMLNRVEKLQQAVKVAREAANMVEAPELNLDALLHYVHG